MIGLPVYLVVKTGEKVGWPLFIGGIVMLIALIVWFRIARARSKEAARRTQIDDRRAALLRKYADPQTVENIMNGTVWQGESAEQVQDSLGPPADMDERVFKTKVKQVWKYERRGVNRFALRVTLENGTVVGWEDKT